MAGKVLVSVRYLARFPVWSCLRLCLDRPAFLAPGCCFLTLGTGGLDGRGAERGPRGTGDGRRRDVDGHWSGAGRGLAQTKRWPLVGR